MKRIVLLVLVISSFTSFGQSLQVFDVDTSSFPVMKAKFFAFDPDFKMLTGFSASDITVTESGTGRQILSVSCPQPEPPKQLSSVLVMDQSGSMGEGDKLKVMREAALAWIDALFITKSECAITSFDDENYLIQDFTANKAALQDRITTIQATGGTNYDKALLDNFAGGIPVAQRGQYNRVIVMLSDGEPNNPPSKTKIINEAKLYNITIYFVTLLHNCSQDMKDITTQTGGMYFENVTTVEQAREIYLKILKIAQGGKPCEIEWQSDIPCVSGSTSVEIKNNVNGSTANFSYHSPVNNIATLEFAPSGISFKNKQIGKKVDTTIIVKALNTSFNITNITVTEPGFDINPKTFSINAGQTINITVSFTPQDSESVFAKFTVENNRCPEFYYASAGYTSIRPKKPTLKITQPNGGEIYPSGSDTLITWEGVLPTDSVRLDYSTDRGISWNMIADSVCGLKYSWKVPNTPSMTCLARVSQGLDILSVNGPKLQWAKCYGADGFEYGYSLVQTPEGGFILVGTTISTSIIDTVSNGGTDIFVVKTDRNGSIEWVKLLGGSGDDYGYKIIPALDNGYIIAGATSSKKGNILCAHDMFDGLILKIDTQGNILWQKSFGGSWDEFFYSVTSTSDNCYILTGYSKSSDGDLTNNKGGDDLWLVKTDAGGNLIWQKNFGGKNSEVGNAVQATPDGGCIVTGYTNSSDGDVTNSIGGKDYWVLKCDIGGNLNWQKCFGTTDADEGTDIKMTKDGDFVIAGTSYGSNVSAKNHGADDFLIIKIDPVGNIIWQKMYGGSNYERYTSLIETYDGGYLISGSSSSYDGDVLRSGDSKHIIDDVWLLKINPDGMIEWQKTFGGSGTDLGMATAETKDGNFVCLGTTYSNDGDVTDFKGASDMWLFKISPFTPLQQDVSDSLWAIVVPHLSAAQIDMGQRLVGSAKDSVISGYFVNTGTYVAQIDSIVFTGPDKDNFSVPYGLFPVFVPPNGSANAEFYFSPKSQGIKSSDFIIFFRGDSLKSTIKGEGLNPKLEVIANCLDFGIVKLGKDTTITDTALIRNSGNTTITITGTVFLPPDYGQFSIVSGGGSFTLNPGEERKLSVKFSPKFGGRTTGLIGFTFNEAGSPAKVTLLGEGRGGLVFMADDSSLTGKKKSLKLMLGLTKAEGIASIASKFKAKIRFEGSVLAPVNRSNAKYSNDSVIVDITGTFGKTETLYNLSVITALGKVEETSLDLLEFNIYDAQDKIVDYNFDLQSGTFKLLGICNEGGARLVNPTGKAGIMNLSPNPANDEFELKINLTEIGKTEISLYNMLGEKITDAFSEEVKTVGERQLKVSTKEIGSGSYLLRFRSPTVFESKQILIVR